MELKFNINQINELADRYGYPLNEDNVTNLIPIIRKQKFMTKNQLQILL